MYNYDSTERLVLDHSGNLNISGVSTATNFKTGSSNLHSTGLTVGDSFVHSTGINLGAGVTFSNDGNATFSGITTFHNGVRLPNFYPGSIVGKIQIGDSNGYEIFHYNNNNYLTFTRDLFIRGDANGRQIKLQPKISQNGILINPNGSVELYHSGTKRFETTNTGVNVTGVLTATSFVGSGALLTGIVGGKFNGPAAGILTTSTVGIQTADVTSADLVGAATSMVGLYIGDGHLLFSNYLNKSGGYYITTGLNALNAGPVTLGSTMTLDGTWVIV